MADDLAALSEMDHSGALDGALSDERALQILGRLAEVGLEIAEAIARQVKDAQPAQPLSELAGAARVYDRVARAVRLCILLQDELIKRRQAKAEAERQAPALRRKAHADRVVGVVKRIARDHCRHEPFAVSQFVKEAAERLDTDDIYGLVESRPVGELVAMICSDFGLKPDWGHLSVEAWAIAEAESGVEGSPFVESEEEAETGTCSAEGRTCPADGDTHLRSMSPATAEGGVPPPPSLEPPA